MPRSGGFMTSGDAKITTVVEEPELKAADRDDWTACTLQQVALSGAVTSDSQMTQRKVIPYGIIAVELAKALGDVDSHPPSRRLHVRESDVARYPGNVCVQGNDKLPRFYFGPHTTVDSVFRAYHPSQI